MPTLTMNWKRIQDTTRPRSGGRRYHVPGRPPAAGAQEQRHQHDDDDRAHEAQLLGSHREDEVGVAHAQEVQLALRAAESRAPAAAPPEPTPIMAWSTLKRSAAGPSRD